MFSAISTPLLTIFQMVKGIFLNSNDSRHAYDLDSIFLICYFFLFIDYFIVYFDYLLVVVHIY